MRRRFSAYSFFSFSFFMETIIQKALKRLLDEFGAAYDCVMIQEDSGHYRANIETPHPARLIGKNGATLSSLQILLKTILWSQSQENVLVTVDVDNYLKQQEEKKIQVAERYINMMQERNLAEIKLPPMRALFRRAVHLWILNNRSDLATESVGEGRDRAIRIFYK